MPGAEKSAPAAPPPPPAAPAGDELAMLRQQMAEMQKKLDSLGR
jgi:hypothetical protein